MIQLDTSFPIRALASGSPEDRKPRGWIGEGKTLGMSTVAWAELLCGPLELSEMEWAAEIVGQHQDFTSEHAELAARLFNEFGRRRGSLIDCMIAATARVADVPIATANAGDFLRFKNFGLTMAYGKRRTAATRRVRSRW